MARIIWKLATLSTVLAFLLLHPMGVVYAEPPMAPSGLQVGGFPGGQMRIAWTDNAANETSFQLERSIHNRAQYTLLATLPANTTVYTDTTVVLDTTYWYRVRACNADGCSAYSKESYNVSFAAEAVPNMDERYLLFLVNESRADPAAYGYPEYAPLPPVMYNALMQYAATHTPRQLSTPISTSVTVIPIHRKASRTWNSAAHPNALAMSATTVVFLRIWSPGTMAGRQRRGPIKRL